MPASENENSRRKMSSCGPSQPSPGLSPHISLGQGPYKGYVLCKLPQKHENCLALFQLSLPFLFLDNGSRQRGGVKLLSELLTFI